MVTVLSDLNGVFGCEASSELYYENPEVFKGFRVDKVRVVHKLYEPWFNLKWSEELVKNISLIQDSLNWIWLTTWTGNTEVIDNLFNFKNTVDAEWVVHPEGSEGWDGRTFRDYRANAKLQYVRNWVMAHPDEPFVWMDDVATTLWLQEYASAPHLILTPDEKYGLTRPELEQFKIFVKTHN